ncbi:hypothetical protein CPLU01_14782 [Colletotrichum plurivorum]|uniref:Uncharacterized protein n=1 Tax=Colletotrichum plurivorum TaxID=2175906 RepID=A0A8H6JH12_9PEZI|nr:hypothetical protein CPLU01_14782 [Colletotrichum plurivorum]
MSLRNAAGAVAEATEIVVSAAGSAQGTYKPILATATITGSVTPALVPVTKETDDLKVGDAIFTMEKHLADKVEEIMRISRHCQDGTDFRNGRIDPLVLDRRQGNNKNKPENRRAWLGSTLCAVQGVIQNALPDAPLGDLAVSAMNAPEMPLPQPGDTQEAIAQALNFADDFAPMLQMPAERAENMGRIVWVPAENIFNDFVEGAIDRHLSDRNVIRESKLQKKITPDPTPRPTPTGQSPITSCASTTERERRRAYCGDVGMIETCETACETKTECQTAAETGTPGTKSIVTLTTAYWMYNDPIMVPSPTAAAMPDCDANKGGGMPAEIFSGPEFNVTKDFCRELDKGDGSSSLSWFVDGRGQYLSPKSRRAPPSSPKQYEDYKVQLEWEPTKKAFAKECTRFDACFEAFKSAASSPCGRAGGGQNVMASEGSFDRGCGKFKWSITPPKPREPGTRYKPLNGPGEQFCHNEFNFPKHKDVRHEDVINQASYACAAAPQKFTKDTPRWQKKYTVSGTDYFFSIEWRGGCRTDVEEQDIGKLDGKNSYPNCWHMMHDSWAKCNNGGVGGNRQAGCLEYTFSPHMAE